jgi:hypothetical protein
VEENQKGGSVPRPDPTVLTTEALLREVTHLRELLTSRLEGLEDRQDAYERVHEAKHRERAAEVEASIRHLTELAAERFAGVTDRFAGIQVQLTERDTRLQDTTQASKDAIAAALAAQKEAVAKSELNTKEQLASIKSENATTVASLESKIENVKDLIGAAQLTVGQQEGRTGGMDVAWGRTVALAGVLVAIAAVIVGAILSRG